MVQWGPEHCTFGDALEPYFLGFDIVSITSLESTISSRDLLPFVATKRPNREQRRSLRRPPFSTSCIVQFAPSPKGPLHSHSISGGSQAFDDFLERETLSLPALPTPVGTSSRSTPIKRSSSPQAPTRAKLRAAAPPTSSHRGNRNGGNLPSSPTHLTRRSHSDLLQIILEEGNPDRDSIPKSCPYASLVPPTSPWNRMGRVLCIHSDDGKRYFCTRFVLPRCRIGSLVLLRYCTLC